MMAKCVDIISGSQSIFLCLATLSIPCRSWKKKIKKLMMKIAFMIIAPGISQTQREARSVNTSEQISIKVD